MDDNHHDHTHVTHSAGCDEQGCSYEARVHAHDDETAAQYLSQDLATHNKEEHDKDTKAEGIKEAVKAKMKTHASH